ncbi:unnamed protein product [Phytophthora lilii]|uniref:Unnamed protein product n=1 Tax=Phytophthora lilii TaxID=2077276 RepID=A0A9W6TWK1_9STRA|nr:unnamed protein product [Phytophthora lilii]
MMEGLYPYGLAGHCRSASARSGCHLCSVFCEFEADQLCIFPRVDRAAPSAPTAGSSSSTPAPASAAVPPQPASAAPAATPAPTVSVPAPSTATPGGGTLTTADLQRAMASFQQFAVGVPLACGGSDATALGSEWCSLTFFWCRHYQQPKPVSLTKLLSADNMSSIFDDPACVEALLPHLPEGSQTPAELRATVSLTILRSPQLRQSIGSLVSALQTGNFNAVMANFGLDPAAGAAKLAFGDGKSNVAECLARGFY